MVVILRKNHISAAALLLLGRVVVLLQVKTHGWRFMDLDLFFLGSAVEIVALLGGLGPVAT